MLRDYCGASNQDSPCFDANPLALLSSICFEYQHPRENDIARYTDGPMYESQVRGVEHLDDQGAPFL